MSLPLIILEGGDCSGKTTLADKLCQLAPDTEYVHYSDEPHCQNSIARFYAEGMLPAVQGHAPVIMDRCWLSEEPYCKVYRPDKSPRTNDADHRILERLALQCQAIIVYCKPPWEITREHFLARSGDEYLDNLKQLEEVRDHYAKVLRRSHLTVVHYDWTVDHEMPQALANRIASLSCDLVQFKIYPGSGNPYAQNLVVGEGWKYCGEFDTHYKWPYNSFTLHSMSRWFATELDRLKVPETSFWWVDHQDLTSQKMFDSMCDSFGFTHIVALGDIAAEKLISFGIPEGDIYLAPSPATWDRTRHSYPGAQLLKELS